jgi:hypothetical protein
MSEFHSDLDPRKWADWSRESYPSTRDSLRLLSKNYPIHKTLTTADTAEDLITMSPVGDGSMHCINYITNPSCETVDTGKAVGFTESGATLADEGTIVKYGSHSAKVTPADSVAGEGIYWAIDSWPVETPIYFSVYVRDAAASGKKVKVMITDDTPTTLASSADYALTATWTRINVKYNLRIHEGAKNLRFYLVTAEKHGTAFYADGFQVEIENLTDYCDGDQGLDHEWMGTSHASVSRRYRHIIEIRYGHLFFAADTYMAIDRTASNTATNEEDRGELILAGTDWNVDHPIRVTKNISFINRWPGDQPEVIGNLWGC